MRIAVGNQRGVPRSTVIYVLLSIIYAVPRQRYGPCRPKLAKGTKPVNLYLVQSYHGGEHALTVLDSYGHQMPVCSAGADDVLQVYVSLVNNLSVSVGIDQSPLYSFGTPNGVVQCRTEFPRFDVPRGGPRRLVSDLRP